MRGARHPTPPPHIRGASLPCIESACWTLISTGVRMEAVVPGQQLTPQF